MREYVLFFLLGNGITVWKNVKFLKIKVKMVVNINSK